MTQYEMSAITAVTLGIYGFIMRHERVKRLLAKRKQTSPKLSAARADEAGLVMVTAVDGLLVVEEP